MKTLGIIFISLSVIGTGLWVAGAIYADYQWQNAVLSNWTLSDKSSTLSAKSDYMDKFVVALKSQNLADNDALIYKTADNNCQNNINAVETLRDRLNQIKGMDESSFQYQQAIQQITSQEQGEADNLLGTLNGCWMKTNHYYLWNGVLGFFGVLILIGFLVFGIIFIVKQNN